MTPVYTAFQQRGRSHYGEARIMDKRAWGWDSLNREVSNGR